MTQVQDQPATDSYKPIKRKSRLRRAFRFVFIKFPFKILPIFIIFVLLPIYFAWHAYLDMQINQRIDELREKEHYANDPYVGLVTTQDLTDKYEVIEGVNLADYLNFYFSRLQRENKTYFEVNTLSGIQKPTTEQYAATKLPFMDWQTPDNWQANQQTVPDELLTTVKNYLATQSDNINALIDLPEYDTVHWQVHYNDGIGVLLPYLGKVRVAARNLALYNWLAVHENRPDDSVRALVALNQLTQSLETSFTLIDQLVLISIKSMLAEEVTRGLNHHIYNDAQLQILFRVVEPINVQETFLNSMRGERAGTLNYLQTLPAKPNQHAMYFNGNDSEVQQALMIVTVNVQHHLGLLKTDTLAMLDLHDWVIDEMQKSQSDIDQLDDKIMGLNRILNMHTRMLFPALGAAHQTMVQIHQHLTTLQLAIAVERYYLTHKDNAASAHEALPNSLADLVPEYILSVPLDLNSYGRQQINGPQISPEYKYRHSDAGYIIYTPGTDQVDHKGNAYYLLGEKGWGRGDTETDVVTDVSFPGKNILLELHPTRTEEYLDKIEDIQQQYLDYIHGRDDEEETDEEVLG